MSGGAVVGGVVSGGSVAGGVVSGGSVAGGVVSSGVVVAVVVDEAVEPGPPVSVPVRAVVDVVSSSSDGVSPEPESVPEPPVGEPSSPPGVGIPVNGTMGISVPSASGWMAAAGATSGTSSQFAST